MAKIVTKVLGGNPKELEAETVGEVKELLNVPNHTAQVNGTPATDDQDLNDDDYVSLSPAVKGGMN